MKSKALTLFSPAKVNLFFRVLNKREDGFHEIASLYQALDFGDMLQIERSMRDQFTSNSSLAFDENHLVIRALKLIRTHLNVDVPVKIHLHKEIPIGGGLGGGSSNAATTLWGYNTLLGNPLNLSELIALGKTLGSDVPFFFSSGSAYCTGTGTLFSDENISLNPFYLALASRFSCTASVYKNVDVSRCSNTPSSTLLESFKDGSGMYINDLEISAFELYPELKEEKKRLESLGFNTVMMTGSGASFVCVGENAFDKSLPRVLPVQRKKGKWYDAVSVELKVT